MKRKLFCGILTFVLLFSLSACAPSTSAPKKSEEQADILQDEPVPLKENYWHLACENTNAVLYRSFGASGLEFELISAFPLEADELVVDVEASNPGISYQVSYYQQNAEEEDFPFHLYQCYQGMGQEGYQIALDQDKLPKLYSYIVGIKFDLAKMGSVECIDAILLTLRGETKRYELDSLVLDAEQELNFENDGILTTLGVSDAPIEISKDGVLDLTDIKLQSEETFTLTGLSFFEEDTAVMSDCSVVLTKAEGTTTEMQWDRKTPMSVMKGESVCIQVFCKDPQLAGVMEANVTKYIMVQYESKGGKTCTELMQGIYRMRQGMYDLYAEADGIDVLSYYLAYDSAAED